MVPKLTQILLGVLASALGALAVWFALGMQNQPFLGLAAATVGVVAIFRPQWSILAVVPVSLIGIGIPVWRVAALGMVAAVGFAILLSPKGKVKLRPAHAVLPVLAAALVASSVWPSVLSIPLRHYGLVTLLAGLVVFAICAALKISPFAMSAVLALSGSATATLVLISARYEGSFAQWDTGRLGGLGQNSNFLGLLLALPLVAAAGLAWHRKQPMWLLSALPCGIAIWLTESRSALIAVFCGLAYAFVAGRRWWWQTAGLTASVLAAVAISQFFFLAEPTPAPVAAAASSPSPSLPPSPAKTVAPSSSAVMRMAPGEAKPQHLAPAALAPGTAPATAAAMGSASVSPAAPDLLTVNLAGSRSQKDLDRSNDVRFRAGVLAGQTTMLYPLRGIGYGAFAEYASTADGFGIYMNTHNEYLRLAVEAGAIALLAFAALLFFGLRQRGSAALAVPRAVVVCFAVFLAFGNPLSNVSLSIAFWIALGVLVANPPKEGFGRDVRAVMAA